MGMILSLANGMKPLSPEGKNDLPRGTVLKLYGYNYPEFVITHNLGVSENFQAYGASYEVINLDTFEYSRDQAYSLYWPKDGIKGIHTEITEKVLSEAEVLFIIEQAAAAKVAKEEKAKQDAIAWENEVIRLKAEYSYLTQEKQNPKLWGPTLAAANIRTELKRTFPGVKFSVRSEKYSGGDSIDVSWTDGPTEEEVKAISGKYKGGYFNGMEDIYEYDHSNPWTRLFGDAKYIFENRHYSRELVEKCAQEVGVEVEWKEHGGYDCKGESLDALDCNRRLLRNKLSETSAYTKPEENKPEPVEEQQIGSVTVRINKEKNGIEIKFPEKPSQGVIDMLKANGWRWSRFGGCWYNRNTEQNRLFARNF